MTKEDLLQKIMENLRDDLAIFSQAAKAAHAAATHEECIPDNKYDTTALEASYIAQGQANRAQETRHSLESYRTLALLSFGEDTPIRLSALVTLEAADGSRRHLFIGPEAGGMKVAAEGREFVVITPYATLGRALLGKVCGDEVQIGRGSERRTFTIVDVG